MALMKWIITKLNLAKTSFLCFSFWQHLLRIFRCENESESLHRRVKKVVGIKCLRDVIYFASDGLFGVQNIWEFSHALLDFWEEKSWKREEKSSWNCKLLNDLFDVQAQSAIFIFHVHVWDTSNRIMPEINSFSAGWWLSGFSCLAIDAWKNENGGNGGYFIAYLKTSTQKSYILAYKLQKHTRTLINLSPYA